ncbi:MAG: hypothetical protein ABFD89_05345 [Bryobacteraceae bacterium]
MKNIKQSFGNIYGGNNPTHGVYTRAALDTWGERAVAISHHWTAVAAEEAAARESAARREPCVAVEYTLEVA